jgi:drug/metabolite transporter (DMT)-like permease
MRALKGRKRFIPPFQGLDQSDTSQGLRSLRSLYPWLLSIALSALSKCHSQIQLDQQISDFKSQISNLKFPIIKVQSYRMSASTSYRILMITSTFLMGSSFIASKILLMSGIPPLPLAGWRFLVAAIATLPIIITQKGRLSIALLPPELTARDWLTVVAIGLLQTALVMGLLFLAMQTIPAPTAAILLFTQPIWVAVLSRLVLGESLSRYRVFGLILGIAGVTLMIGSLGDSLAGGALIGKLLGLGAAFCWGLATIVNKRIAIPLGAWTLNFWQMFIGALALLAIAFINNESWPATTTLAEWGWFLWLAVPASTGSFGLWFLALSRGTALRTSGFLFLAPLFTVLLSVIVLGAGLSWIQWLGGVLVGSGLWLVNRS